MIILFLHLHILYYKAKHIQLKLAITNQIGPNDLTVLRHPIFKHLIKWHPIIWHLLMVTVIWHSLKISIKWHHIKLPNMHFQLPTFDVRSRYLCLIPSWKIFLNQIPNHQCATPSLEGVKLIIKSYFTFLQLGSGTSLMIWDLISLDKQMIKSGNSILICRRYSIFGFLRRNINQFY